MFKESVFFPDNVARRFVERELLAFCFNGFGIAETLVQVVFLLQRLLPILDSSGEVVFVNQEQLFGGCGDARGRMLCETRYFIGRKWVLSVARTRTSWGDVWD